MDAGVYECVLCNRAFAENTRSFAGETWFAPAVFDITGDGPAPGDGTYLPDKEATKAGSGPHAELYKKWYISNFSGKEKAYDALRMNINHNVPIDPVHLGAITSALPKNSVVAGRVVPAGTTPKDDVQADVVCVLVAPPAKPPSASTPPVLTVQYARNYTPPKGADNADAFIIKRSVLELIDSIRATEKNTYRIIKDHRRIISDIKTASLGFNTFARSSAMAANLAIDWYLPEFLAKKARDTRSAISSRVMDSVFNIKNRRGHAALHYAAENNDAATAQALLNVDCFVDIQITETGVTPLMIAVSKGHIDICEILFTRSPDINATDTRKHDALFHAVDSDDAATVKYMFDKHTGIIATGTECLLRANTKGETVLAYACNRDNRVRIDVVNMLVAIIDTAIPKEKKEERLGIRRSIRSTNLAVVLAVDKLIK